MVARRGAVHIQQVDRNRDAPYGPWSSAQGRATGTGASPVGAAPLWSHSKKLRVTSRVAAPM